MAMIIKGVLVPRALMLICMLSLLAGCPVPFEFLFFNGSGANVKIDLGKSSVVVKPGEWTAIDQDLHLTFMERSDSGHTVLRLAVESSGDACFLLDTSSLPRGFVGYDSTRSIGLRYLDDGRLQAIPPSFTPQLRQPKKGSAFAPVDMVRLNCPSD